MIASDGYALHTLKAVLAQMDKKTTRAIRFRLIVSDGGGGIVLIESSAGADGHTPQLMHCIG